MLDHLALSAGHPAWWHEELATYLLGLFIGITGLATYAGWAFDGLDDTAAGRLARKLATLWVCAPLGFVLARQALGVPWSAAPSAWPATADVVARGVITVAGLCLGTAIIVLTRRVRPSHPQRGWALCALIQFALAALTFAAFPWLTAWLSSLILGASIAAQCTGAVLAASRLR